MHTPVQIHKLTWPDLAQCEAIDRRTSPAERAWPLATFSDFFDGHCHGGFGAFWQGSLVAYLLYSADQDNRRLHLVRIGVARSWQGRHIGTQLLSKVQSWLHPVPDVAIWALIHERQLAMQCFLRANGFRAIGVFRGRYDNGTNDGYLFELPAAQAAVIPRD